MGNRLLLADDSITIQKVVAIIFANEEYELSVVDNGNAALEKAREISPDLMLVDALMPGKSGYEVCSEIRRDPKLGQIPLLLLIGAFEPLDEDKARSCGADATISKPFESQQLIDKVKELLELAKTRKSAPAPTAAPQPAMAAAEDVWGDLSSLDTMTSFQPAPPKAAHPAAPAAPAAPAPEPQPAAAPKAAAPSAPPVEEQIQEATLEDDLWGAFELEEEVQPQPAAPAKFGVEPAGEFEAEEFFTFEEEEEEIEETGPPLELVEEPAEHPSAEELFSFEEESSFGATEEAQPAKPQEGVQLPEYEPFSFEEEAFEATPAEELTEAAPQAAAPPQGAPEPFAETLMQRTPLAAAAPQQAPQPQPAAAAATGAAPPQPQASSAAVGLTEEDLKAALSKISKEVIERIVWEVVPDLAEVLIKEEIKKLKAGVRG